MVSLVSIAIFNSYSYLTTKVFSNRLHSNMQPLILQFHVYCLICICPLAEVLQRTHGASFLLMLIFIYLLQFTCMYPK